MSHIPSLDSPGRLGSLYPSEYPIQKSCCSVKTKGLLVFSLMVLLLLSVIAVGVCSAVGCINVKVGGGLIIGMSAVVSCPLVGMLKIHWKRIRTVQSKILQRGEQGFGCFIGSLLLGTITSVVVGALLLSSIISPMVGGFVTAAAIPVLPLGGSVIACMCSPNRT